MDVEVETAGSVRIRLNADVRCNGVRFGWTAGIAMDPETCQITHLVIREKGVLGVERMAPVHLVEEIAPGYIELNCKGSDLAQLEDYTDAHDGLGEFPDPLHTYGDYLVWPYRMPARLPMGMRAYESVPPRTVVLRQGARVMATNGLVGHVNGLAVWSEDWRITHLRLQKNQPWGQKVFNVPVSGIARIEEDAVYLQLSRAAVKGCRTVPSG